MIRIKTLIKICCLFGFLASFTSALAQPRTELIKHEYLDFGLLVHFAVFYDDDLLYEGKELLKELPVNVENRLHTGDVNLTLNRLINSSEMVLLVMELRERGKPANKSIRSFPVVGREKECRKLMAKMELMDETPVMVQNAVKIDEEKLIREVEVKRME